MTCPSCDGRLSEQEGHNCPVINTKINAQASRGRVICCACGSVVSTVEERLARDARNRNGGIIAGLVLAAAIVWAHSIFF